MQGSEKINLVFSGITFTAANISLDLQKGKEAIYYTPKEDVQTSVVYDVNAKTIAGRLDHFSFHADGNVHAKYKEKNRTKKGLSKLPLYYHIGKLPDGLFPKNKKIITPLIVDSIFTNSGEWPVPPSHDQMPDSYHWSFAELQELSLLIFLVDRTFTHDILHQYEMFQKLIFHNTALRIPFVDDWELLVCASSQTLPEIFPESLSTFGLSCKRKICPHFSRQIIAGPKPLTFKHLSFGRSIVMPKDEET
jgi:hypothetical protein